MWTVSPAGDLDRVGALVQPKGPTSDLGYPEIERAAVVGNDIYTLSELGVMVNDSGSLAQVAWLPYQGGS